jgi:hypothetical protein
LGTPDAIERTLLKEIELQVNGNCIDPLQKTIDSVDVIEAVKKVVNERIAQIVNLKFVFVDNPSDAVVRISFDPLQGAWSLIGTDCLLEKDTTKATMNLGWFDVATTMHEFGHTLGLIHEHQNPLGKAIAWDDEKVYEWANKTQGWDKETTYTNIIKKYEKDQINGTEFDPKSIMLYFFPASLTTNHQGTEVNLRLSKYDAQYINSVYPTTMPIDKFYSRVYGETLTPMKFHGIRATTTTYGKLGWSMYVAPILLLVIIAVACIMVFGRTNPSKDP